MGDQPETAEPGSTRTATTAAGRAERKRARATRRSAKNSLKESTRRSAKDAAEAAPNPPSEVREQLRGLLGASHPRQTLLTALVVAAAALVSGRALREALVAGAAVLVVQAILGLVNDVVDRERDAATGRADGPLGKPVAKPVAGGRLPAGNASFAAVCLTIIAIPLSLQNGSAAALALLGTLLVGLAYELRLRRTALSWLPWAVGYGLLPAFLSYGGWGAGLHGAPPTWAMTALVAMLGVGVHFLTSLPDLVADNKSGVRHLPLRIALKTGASRLLVISAGYTALVAIGVVVAAFTVGLRQAPLG